MNFLGFSPSEHFPRCGLGCGGIFFALSHSEAPNGRIDEAFITRKAPNGRTDEAFITRKAPNSRIDEAFITRKTPNGRIDET